MLKFIFIFLGIILLLFVLCALKVSSDCEKKKTLK